MNKIAYILIAVIALITIAGCDMAAPTTTNPTALIGGWRGEAPGIIGTLTFTGTELSIVVTDGVTVETGRCNYSASNGIVTLSGCSGSFSQFNGFSVAYSITGNTLKYGLDTYRRL